MRNLLKGIIFMLIFVGTPLLANLIVEITTNIITIENVLKTIFVSLGIISIYLVKECAKDGRRK